MADIALPRPPMLLKPPWKRIVIFFCCGVSLLQVIDQAMSVIWGRSTAKRIRLAAAVPDAGIR